MKKHKAPSVHAHLDSYQRPADGKSKFFLRVDIGGKKKLYPLNVHGCPELYMDKQYWVNETEEVTQPDGTVKRRKLRRKRISHAKGNYESKWLELKLHEKITEMGKLVVKVQAEKLPMNHDTLSRLWGRKVVGSFAKWARAWFENYREENELSKSAIKQYKQLLNYLQEYEDFAGACPLQEITPRWLIDFQAWMYKPKKEKGGAYTGRGLQETTGSRHMRRLGRMFKIATFDKEIVKNPYWEFVKLGFQIRVDGNVERYLEEEEITLMWEAYQTEQLREFRFRTKHGHMRNCGGRLHQRLGVFLFMIYTGLRCCDIQRIANTGATNTDLLEISPNNLRVRMKKTDKWVKIPITERMRAVANLSGMGPIFPFKVPGYLALWGDLKRVLSILGIKRRITPHDLRRTFATTLLNRGGEMKGVSKLLGHSSTQITEQHYAFAKDDMIVRTAKLWDEDEEVRGFADPKVSKFVREMYRLILDNPDLEIPREVREQLEALKAPLGLEGMEKEPVSKPGKPRVA